MPRLGLGLGLNLPKPVYLGGISAPSGFVGQYLSYYFADFNLVTGDNVETWGDRSTNNNDLTQTTSANQPLLVENDVVKQSTLADQPTLVDTGGGDLAVQSDGNDGLAFSSPLNTSGNWTMEIDFSSPIADASPSDYLLSKGDASSTSSFRLLTNGQPRLTTGEDTFISLNGNLISNTRYKIHIVRDGNDISFYRDGVFNKTADFTGNTFNPTELLRSASSSGLPNLFGFRFWDVAVSDVNNITEPVSQEYLPQTQYLRNSSGVEASAGDDISAWLSTTHLTYKNRVVFDGANDNMTGLPPQAGDFSYVWKGEHSALSTTDYVFSSTGTPSAFVWLSDNILYLRDTTGANDIGLTNYTLEAGEHVFVLVREGNDIRFYVDSILKQTVDVTGRTYTIDTIGDSADSLSGAWSEFYTYSKALTQDEINYWSYLRNEAGEILLPPLLPS